MFLEIRTVGISDNHIKLTFRAISSHLLKTVNILPILVFWDLATKLFIILELANTSQSVYKNMKYIPTFYANGSILRCQL